MAAAAVDNVPLEWVGTTVEVASPAIVRVSDETEAEAFVTPTNKSRVTPIEMVHAFEDTDLDPGDPKRDLATPAWMKKRLSVRKAMARTPMSPAGQRPSARNLGEHPGLRGTPTHRDGILDAMSPNVSKRNLLSAASMPQRPIQTKVPTIDWSQVCFFTCPVRSLGHPAPPQIQNRSIIIDTPV
jgi:hypothetical protein